MQTSWALLVVSPAAEMASDGCDAGLVSPCAWRLSGKPCVLRAVQVDGLPQQAVNKHASDWQGPWSLLRAA